MKCPYCNRTCLVTIFSEYKDIEQFSQYNCYDIDHAFYQRNENWYIRDMQSNLVVNSFGIHINSKTIIKFPTPQNPSQAIPSFKKVLKHKAFL